MLHGADPHTVTSFRAHELDKLVDFLNDRVLPRDVVLVKGSRALAMEHVVDALSDPAGWIGANLG